MRTEAKREFKVNETQSKTRARLREMAELVSTEPEFGAADPT